MADRTNHLLIRKIPYQRNKYFTGQEDILHRIHKALRGRRVTAITQPQGISGLGGIGKTQIALEYTFHYAEEYRAIFWMRADSYSALASEFVTLATLLDLPEKTIRNQSLIIRAVMRWLKEHSNWLLVFDNADDMDVVSEFIPKVYQGHILLTTRAHALGTIAYRIEVEKMPPEEGALLLLRRASIIPVERNLDGATDTDRAVGMEISSILDGLPLALDQAGAYIQETGCDVSKYLTLYKQQHSQLLHLRGQQEGTDYPASVATTWALSFEKVAQVNLAAAELLRFFAFLSPDNIHEDLIIEGAPDLSPTLQLAAEKLFAVNEMIRQLLKFSLVQRTAHTKTYTIHRLVQAVIKDDLGAELESQWAEWVVRAVNRVFPDVEFKLWARCQQCLSHAKCCATYIRQWDMAFAEAISLIEKGALYLYELAQYEEAAQFAQLALAIYERVRGPEHSSTAIAMTTLGAIYEEQGEYAKAEHLYKRSLDVKVAVYGRNHPEVCDVLTGLGSIYMRNSDFGQASSFFAQALEITEQTKGSEHTETAHCLNNLSACYVRQRKYGDAEPLLEKALAIHEKTLGLDHPMTGRSLNNLGGVYQKLGKYEKLEQLLTRCLALFKAAVGLNHPDTAVALYNLARLYRIQGKYDQAESLFVQALELFEKTLGPNNPELRRIYGGYARQLWMTKRKVKAIKLFLYAFNMPIDLTEDD